jgi:hypothetical protein
LISSVTTQTCELPCVESNEIEKRDSSLENCLPDRQPLAAMILPPAIFIHVTISMVRMAVFHFMSPRFAGAPHEFNALRVSSCIGVNEMCLVANCTMMISPCQLSIGAPFAARNLRPLFNASLDEWH